MKYLFSPAGWQALTHFAATNLLVAFDFDGTLSPIVRDPGRAGMRAGTRTLLAELCARYPCAIISGRASADVRALLGGARVHTVVGNHGAELFDPAPTSRKVKAWHARLGRQLKSVTGVKVEDKRLSLSIHYRAAPDKKVARAAIGTALDTLERAIVIPGKQVVNVLPPGSRRKGDALSALLERDGYGAAVYVGDDETDEDVFRDADTRRLLGIHVGTKRTTAAEYYLRSQTEVDRLLRALVSRRERPG